MHQRKSKKSRRNFLSLPTINRKRRFGIHSSRFTALAASNPDNESAGYWFYLPASCAQQRLSPPDDSASSCIQPGLETFGLREVRSHGARSPTCHLDTSKF